MLTAKYRDAGEIIDITKHENPRASIDRNRLVCKFCDNPMSIRQGLIRAKHFFHLQACTCDFDRHAESAEHNLAKELIANHVREFWSDYSEVRVLYEYAIPEARRIADVAMVFPSGWVVVHEIQLSPITTEHLKKRTDDYHSVGIDTFWWLGKSADTPANRQWSIANYGYALSLDYKTLESRANGLQEGVGKKRV